MPWVEMAAMSEAVTMMALPLVKIETVFSLMTFSAQARGARSVVRRASM